MRRIAQSYQHQPIDKTEAAYSRYRNILDELRSMHSNADRSIETKVEDRLKNLLQSKTADAEFQATAEVEKIEAKIQEKIHKLQTQNNGQGQDQLSEAVAQALAQFRNQTQEAQTSLNDSMKKAGKSLQIIMPSVSADSKYKIIRLKESHVNSVREAWKTFNEAFRAGLNGSYVSIVFECEVAYAKEAFESARDSFLKALDGLGNDEYEMAVAQALTEFQKLVSSAQDNFFGAIKALVKQEVKEGSDVSPAAPPSGYEELKPGLHGVTAREEEKVVQNPLDVFKILEKLVQEMAKIAQRLDSLESKMQEMMKNIQSTNDR